MIVLLSGLFLFFGIHLLPTQPNVREGIRKNFGVGSYMAIFNIVSLLSFVMIVIGYGQMQGAPTRVNPQFWVSLSWARHITFLLMVPAFILLAAAYVPSRIRDAAKHPMLASIKLWAFAHLLVRGDLAGVLLFGSFLAYGIYDRISVKNRVALGPLGTRKGTLKGDIIAVVAGLAAYAFVLFWGHANLIGKPLLRVAA